MKYKWRGGRVVEGARLESVYRGNSIMGANPILSAINFQPKNTNKNFPYRIHLEEKHLKMINKAINL